MFGAIRRLFNPTDSLFGDVRPPRPAPPRSAMPIDGRTAALRVLREYLTELTYYLPMVKSEDAGPLAPDKKAFRLLESNFFLSQADWNQEQKYPSAVVISIGEIEAQGIGFVPVLEEETRDKFGPNTAIERHHAHVEKLAVEVWASTEPELRSLIAGMETAFNPSEGRAGLLLAMPQYFNQKVRFLMTGRERSSDNDSLRGRRHEQLKLSMDFHVVSLVNVAPLQPRVQMSVGYDPQTGKALSLETTPGASFTVPPDATDASRARRTVG